AVTTASELASSLIQAVRRNGIERMVYLSTIHVYGAECVGHVTEDTPARPVHPYAMARMAAEDLLLSAHRGGELTCAALRVSNAVGAPADPDVGRWTLAGNNLCRQAATSSQLVLKSGSGIKRDFIPLSDVLHAI